MLSFFGHLQDRLSQPYENRLLSRCACGQQIFFNNSVCLACHSPLGFVPETGRVMALVPAYGQHWFLAGSTDSKLYRRCANLETPSCCNWLLQSETGHRLCLACQLSQTIPDLSITGNAELWGKLENAKRQLVAQLLSLGLPVQAKSENQPLGLAFNFLGPDPSGNKPITGHAGGLITVSIEEADDAAREAVRTQMGEPYRTLLGHFRHEVGHYYWERLIAGSYWLELFRSLFGDERNDYGQAMQGYYAQGAPSGWQQYHISAYATMHPWEDWAESWAHYLHMTDTLDTALRYGMRLADVQLDYPPFTEAALYDNGQGPNAGEFLVFINAWVKLAAILNELSRSMGQPLLYPFVLSAPVVGKLYLIHCVVNQAKNYPPV